MKKFNPFIVLFVVALLFATSCNKVYHCECRENNQVVSNTAIETLGKKGAQNVCDTYEAQANINGARQTCTLK